MTTHIAMHDRVYDVADPRHVGKVVQINYGQKITVTVKWEGTGFKTVRIPIQCLRHVKKEKTK
jgi:hypothetical protein